MTTVHRIFSARLRLAYDRYEGKKGGLEKLTGYSMTHIHRMMKSTNANPTVAFVWAIAPALGVTPGWLLGLEYGNEDL